MRTIEWSGQFKRDYRRIKKGPHGSIIDLMLSEAAGSLAKDEPLPTARRDHALTGDWRGYRDCHLRPDLVLIYRIVDEDLVRFARLGSHSELGL